MQPWTRVVPLANWSWRVINLASHPVLYLTLLKKYLLFCFVIYCPTDADCLTYAIRIRISIFWRCITCRRFALAKCERLRPRWLSIQCLGFVCAVAVFFLRGGDEGVASLFQQLSTKAVNWVQNWSKLLNVPPNQQGSASCACGWQ